MKGLSKQKFKAWLESKHPRTKVGMTSECRTCPIAKFLTQTHPIDRIYEVTEFSVDVHCSEREHFYKEYLLPKWAKKFVELIDGEDGISSESVSASRALSVLRKCA